MDKDTIIKIFSDYGLQISDDVAVKFVSLMNLTLEANKHLNLTSITDDDDFVSKMILDSVLVSKDLDLSSGALLDVGTGAGFPGIPLAIMYPELNVTLLDSTNKKIKHCQTVVDELGLKNVSLSNFRMEEFARTHRETFDFITARAVAPLNVLLELTIPALKTGGTLIAYKGSSYEEEVEASSHALSVLSSSIDKKIEYTLPTSTEKRVYLLIHKSSKTYEIYPRNYRIISKNPL
ncbi:MAG: 16S rRNA (guanine(527)-N(7))-methyltransferase RsmG [Coprobacillus sp.]|nr:16S rRNA (guanine(527)-N(7))-methyltransferase RsmG [Coprobacillus sp.]